MPHLITVSNPFRPYDGRQVKRVKNGLTVQEIIEVEKINFTIPFICLVNGEATLRGQWSVRIITRNDVISFVTLPQGGGGGGGGGKNPLRTVLSIAVMVAAPAIGGALAGSLGVTSAIGTALISAGVALAGAALVNVLVPPPKPSAPSIGGVGNTTIPSPTYSLQSQGNQARLGQPIPVIYGRHVTFPDLASTPYFEYANNDQYLYQLHCIGRGLYDLEQIRIEDTPISSFEEVEYELVEPGGEVTLFDADVVTAPEVAGQEMLSEADGVGWIGPFAVNPPETQAHQIGIDIVFSRGLYYADNNGNLQNKTVNWQVQARTIDNDGDSVGDWTTLGTESHTANTNEQIRLTYNYPVSSDRYEVRLQRTDTKDTDSRAGHEARWQGVKGYLDDESDFGDVTLLAVKMRATDNLSQRSSRLVNCIVTRKLPMWDPDNGWSEPLATRSIAWAFVDACRAEYGAELADDRIDLQALYDLHQTWEARGDYFDAVFDQIITVWEALTRISRCGRSVSFMQGGIVRCVRDEEKTLPVALFSPRNIVRGSFKIQYLMPGEDTADAVKVEFYNNQIWAPDEVTASLPDSMAEKPAGVSLFGCTGEDQANREGLYMAAANRYRRRMITFQTELEGLIPTYGDLITISHDMPRWGQGGEVIHLDGLVLKLSEPLEWEDDQGNDVTHYIALRRRDGSVSGPWEVTPNGNNADEALLAETLDFTPYTGTAEERTHFSFGPSENWGLLARVLGVRPRGDLVEISAVGENPIVHSFN